MPKRKRCRYFRDSDKEKCICKRPPYKKGYCKIHYSPPFLQWIKGLMKFVAPSIAGAIAKEKLPEILETMGNFMLHNKDALAETLSATEDESTERYADMIRSLDAELDTHGFKFFQVGDDEDENDTTREKGVHIHIQ